MPETRIANVIVPEVFADYMLERALDKSAFYQSDVIVPNSVISQKIAGGGEQFQVPFWKDLVGASDVPSETVATAVNNITSDKMVARRQFREKAWGANDLSAALAGSDPFEAIGERVTSFWNGAMQRTLLATANGVLADNVASDSSDLVNDIAIEDGDSAADANLISSSAIVDTVFLQGDRFDEFGALALHSVPYKAMVSNDLIEFVPDSQGRLTIPTFMGLRVIVDDGLPVVAGGTSGFKYTSFVFKRGAFGYGESANGIVPVEVDRDPSTGMGVDVLYTRRQFAIHPIGMAWLEGSVAGVSPTDTELEAAANWNRVYDAKNVGFAALITNG